MYCRGLKDVPLKRIEIAEQTAIKRCRKMPLPAVLIEFANEQGVDARFGQQESNPQFTTEKPLLDIVRLIAREICLELVGREYDSLDAVKDKLLIQEVFSEANTVRYIRMGCAGKWLKPTPKQLEMANRGKRGA